MRSRSLIAALALLAFGADASADSDPKNLPSTVYLICFVSQTYQPPKNDFYASQGFVSPVAVDKAPKSMSTLKEDNGDAYTKAGAQATSDMVDWLIIHFKEPSHRSLTGCRMFDTRLEAQQELEAVTDPMGGYVLAGDK